MPFKHIDIYKYYKLIYDVCTKYMNYTNTSLIDKCNENLQRFMNDCTKKYYLDSRQNLIKYNSQYINITNHNLEYVCEYIPDNFIDYKYNLLDNKVHELENIILYNTQYIISKYKFKNFDK